MLITDGRFSGGTTGLCVGHIAPEAVDGGPIAFLEDGDEIVLDVANGLLDVSLDTANWSADARRGHRRRGPHRVACWPSTSSSSSPPTLAPSAADQPVQQSLNLTPAAPGIGVSPRYQASGVNFSGKPESTMSPPLTTVEA